MLTISEKNYVHDNTISLGGGQVGLKQYVDDTSYFTSKGNSFDSDHYARGLPSRSVRLGDGTPQFRAVPVRRSRESWDLEALKTSVLQLDRCPTS